MLMLSLWNPKYYKKKSFPFDLNEQPSCLKIFVVFFLLPVPTGLCRISIPFLSFTVKKKLLRIKIGLKIPVFGCFELKKGHIWTLDTILRDTFTVSSLLM
jgi:hypothetical protein